MKKGYIYTLEAMIAVAIILVTLAIVLKTQPVSPDIQTGILKKQGYTALHFIDQKGELREMVMNNDIEGIKSSLENLLSSSIGFNATICDSVCELTFQENKTVTSIDYYISAYKDSFLQKKVRLLLWSEL